MQDSLEPRCFLLDTLEDSADLSARRRTFL